MAEGSNGDDRIRVEVAYARPDRQALLALRVPRGTTAIEAVQASGVLERFPEIDLDRQGIGVFSQPVSPQRVLADGDRVEIYRPLKVDPKEMRRQRARTG
ncbi:RnfH family protein [Arhodomonas sp. SL1]|uniref:RnfH family protein n=1 Tax=Arhodomonas sp. SL1 TaxID=3425691 RepID=UPI003F882188